MIKIYRLSKVIEYTYILKKYIFYLICISFSIINLDIVLRFKWLFTVNMVLHSILNQLEFFWYSLLGCSPSSYTWGLLISSRNIQLLDYSRFAQTCSPVDYDRTIMEYSKNPPFHWEEYYWIGFHVNWSHFVTYQQVCSSLTYSNCLFHIGCRSSLSWLCLLYF
jgi:hypothetical protein